MIGALAMARPKVELKASRSILPFEARWGEWDTGALECWVRHPADRFWSKFERDISSVIKQKREASNMAKIIIVYNQPG